MTSPKNDKSSANFRLAMRGIASTVCVITSCDGKRTHGMTVTSLTSLTMAPPALLVCINRSANLSDVLRVAEGYCVNVLGIGQEAISRAFGGGASVEERFSVGNWCHEAETGTPYLADAQTSLFCRKTAAIPYGTHIILIGDVTSVILREGSGPLIYQNAGYTSLPERAC